MTLIRQHDPMVTGRKDLKMLRRYKLLKPESLHVVAPQARHQGALEIYSP